MAILVQEGLPWYQAQTGISTAQDLSYAKNAFFKGKNSGGAGSTNDQVSARLTTLGFVPGGGSITDRLQAYFKTQTSVGTTDYDLQAGTFFSNTGNPF